MKQGIGKTICLLALALVLFTPVAAQAADVQGSFTGKASCQNGRKKAEFKSETTMMTTYHTSDEIKRRIDALTWPGSSDTASFSEREKEKIALQHALKMLKDLDCDAQTAPPPAEAPMPLPPALSPGARAQ